MIAMTALESWHHLPHWIRALVLGNLLQTVFFALLRLLAGRVKAMQPIIDLIGPRSLRSSDAKRAGCAAALVWFGLAWYVGHLALQFRADVIGWLLKI